MGLVKLMNPLRAVLGVSILAGILVIALALKPTCYDRLVFLALPRNQPSAQVPVDQPASPPPDNAAIPTQTDTIVQPGYVKILLLYDYLPARKHAASYARWARDRVLQQKRHCLGLAWQPGQSLFIKVRAEIYTDPRVYALARAGIEQHAWLAVAWANLITEPYPSEVSFLPANPFDIVARTASGDVAIFTNGGNLSDTDISQGEFLLEARPANDTAEAKRALVDLLDASGCGFGEPLRLIQLFPELRLLRIRVPIKNRGSLHVVVSRENLYRLHAMGRRYYNRSKGYMDDMDDAWYRHAIGQITQIEAQREEEIVAAQENRFKDDLWLECERFFEGADLRRE